MMVTLLDLKGYSVVTEANPGAEALRAAREQRPCLILLDLIMPVMDGVEFRAAQLADAALSSIPVVCVSGRYNAADMAREIGAVALLEKPIAVDSLLDTVPQHFPVPPPTKPPQKKNTRRRPAKLCMTRPKFSARPRVYIARPIAAPIAPATKVLPPAMAMLPNGTSPARVNTRLPSTRHATRNGALRRRTAQRHPRVPPALSQPVMTPMSRAGRWKTASLVVRGTGSGPPSPSASAAPCRGPRPSSEKPCS